jgi:C4-dicarboxylate-specific signal transduction histidine kinase
VITVDEVPWFASSTKISVGALDWRVVVMRPEALVYQPIFNIVWLTTASTAILLGVVVLLFVWSTRKFALATEALSHDALSLEQGHIPAARIFRVKELTELDRSLRSMAGNLLQREALLIQSNEALEARVEERTQHLSQANAELGSAMHRLQQTQADLVQAGKMAALGSMVAGVAHEMNTPVGNARLAATSLVHRAQQLRIILESTRVSREEISQCAVDFEEGASLIDRSLERAADLVRSFKQVAVDQTSNRYRVFILNEIIHENQVLLSPRLTKAHVAVTTHSPPKVEIAGYPGDVGQVLTNLIENAMVHGYADGQGGEVVIDVVLHAPNRVRIQVRDRGCGIPEASLGRIFDPFFTSRMGQGGSGLGLSIVYNLVTRSLAGSIVVESVVGQGTTFTVDMPMHAPERNEPTA